MSGSCDETRSLPLTLRAAAARVERAFCKGGYAIDAAGCDVDACNPTAVAWCAIGAIEVEAKNIDQALDARRFFGEVFGLWPANWNDAYSTSAGEMATALCLLADVLETAGVG